MSLGDLLDGVLDYVEYKTIHVERATYKSFFVIERSRFTGEVRLQVAEDGDRC